MRADGSTSAVADDAARRPEAPGLEIPQPRGPALRGLPIPTLDGQGDMAPVAQAGENDQHRRRVPAYESAEGNYS